MWKVKILVLVMECRNHSRALGIVWSVLVLLGFLSSHISLLYSVQPILLHMLPSFPASWAKHVHSQASIPNSWQNHKNLPHRYISLNISPPHIIPYSVISQSMACSCNWGSLWESPFPLKTEGEGELWNQAWTPSSASERVQQQILSWCLLNAHRKRVYPLWSWPFITDISVSRVWQNFWRQTPSLLYPESQGKYTWHSEFLSHCVVNNVQLLLSLSNPLTN